MALVLLQCEAMPQHGNSSSGSGVLSPWSQKLKEPSSSSLRAPSELGLQALNSSERPREQLLLE